MAGPPRRPTGVPFISPTQERAFAQNVDRLVKRTTIVTSADDIRRNVTLCMVGGRPCSLELGDNIAVTEGFQLPGGMKSFSIDGAQRFRLIVNGTLPHLFYPQGAELNNGFPVEVRDVTVQLKEGAVLTTVFKVEQVSAVSTATFSDALSVIGVDIDATNGTCTNVFSHGDFRHPLGFKVARIHVDRLSTTNVDNLIAFDDTSCTWKDCTIRNVAMASSVAMSFGLGGISAVFNGVVENLVGNINVSLGAKSKCSFQYASINDFTGNSTGPTSGKITLLRVDTFGTRTLTAQDVDLDNLVGGSGLSDGNYGDVTVTGGGTIMTVTRPQMKSATVTVAFGLGSEAQVTVVDADCTLASRVLVGWGSTSAADENQPCSSQVSFTAVPAAGSFELTICGQNGELVGGTYKILYTLG